MTPEVPVSIRAASFEAPKLKEGEREPFIIRGHHLRHVHKLLVSRLRPRPLIQAISIGTCYIDFFGEDIPNKTDAYGDTMRSALQVMNGQRQFFRGFLDLPLDADVKLAVNQKDGICKSCAIGKHCTDPDKGSYSDDAFYIYRFVERARMLGIADAITLEENPETHETVSVLTTKSTVVAVTRDFEKLLKRTDIIQFK